MATKIFTRRLDEVGRIVLPLEHRMILNLKNGDSFNIDYQDEKIILVPSKKTE